MTQPNVSRREFLETGAAALAAANLTACAATQSATEESRPIRKLNILFLMDDQHRGDCLGCDGHPVVRTPNLDRLAREGARFSRAYSSLPSCLPARMTLLTGQSPWTHGLLGYSRIPERLPISKPRIFRENGYQTHAVGKMHFSPQRNTHGYHQTILEEGWHTRLKGNFRCDYTQWFEKTVPGEDLNATGLGYTDHRARHFRFDDYLHPTNWTARQGIEFLEHYDGDKPFFLKVSFQRPHPPFDPPKRCMDLYADADLPKVAVGAWSEKRCGKPLPPPDPAKERNQTRGNFGPELVRESRQGYYGAVSHVDEQIGRVLDVLEKRGLLENTLVLFTADHGDMMGDHHHWRKTYAYEGSARVPLIVRWPKSLDRALGGAQRGRAFAQPVELRDVLPTFLDAAGIPIPDAVEGRSLLELVRGETHNWREILDLEHAQIYFPENQWNALTDGRHKYIYGAVDGSELLFDLDNDPYETNDLSQDPQHASRLKEWRQRLIEHLAPRGERWVQNGNLTLRKTQIMHGPNFPDTPEVRSM